MYPSLDIDFKEEFVSPHSPETLARLVNPEMVRKSVAILQRRNLDVNITA
jgi:hypothetical protein